MPLSVGSVNSSVLAQHASQPEALEKKGPGGKDLKIDGDGDDFGSANTVKPTVNTSGQKIGQIINTKG